METIFLETNALNSCLTNNYSGTNLRNILSKKKLTPVVSQHTTYELVRNFISDKNQQIGIKLFSILGDLNPIYSCQTTQLLRREVNKFINGTACDFIIESEFLNPLKDAIQQFSLGNIDKYYVEYVANRELEIKNNSAKQWESIFQDNKIVNFDDFYRDTICKKENITFFIKNMCDIKLNDLQAEGLSIHINEFKAIKTAIRANLYMSYIARNNKISPSKDKNDDFRHLIDSSLCTYFVTNDNDLKKYAQIINTEIRVMSFEEIIN